jgi:bifunctional enzyme CysN/CysC
MPWYAGQTLFQMLEELEPARQREQAFSFPVQWVARTGDFRGLAGTVAGGRVQVGQSIVALPSGVTGTVKSITTFDGQLPEASAEDAVCIEMEQDLDISRGDVLADAETPLDVADAFSARIIWLNEPELARGRSYIFRQGTVETGAVVFEIAARMDLDSLSEVPAKTLLPNDIGRIKLSLDRSVPFAPYAENRDLGGFLLIDRISGNTLGAGMIDFALRRSSNVQWHDFTLNKEAHALQKQQTPRVLWFTGLSASGKSSLADVAARALYAHGRHTYLLDGDNLRHGLNRDLGFTAGDRAENIRRAGEVARLMLDAGLIVLACFISPYEAEREALRERFLPGEFLEIFVDTPLEECIRRDPKGLYAKALAGEIPNFTGISAPFEPPRHPALRVDGTKPLDDLAEEVLRLLL